MYKLGYLITEYLQEIEYDCENCVCSQYCEKVWEEENITYADTDCHGMIEGWLNS